MGFEPRAAERLRLAVLSANGALDDIAHLIGAASDEPETQPASEATVAKQDTPPAGRRRSVA
jgi:hypothetical protein